MVKNLVLAFCLCSCQLAFAQVAPPTAGGSSMSGAKEALAINWSVPVALKDRVTVIHSSFRDGSVDVEPSLPLQAVSGANIDAPADGILLHAGAFDRFTSGWVIRHDSGLISVLTITGGTLLDPFNQLDIAPAKVGARVRGGERLATVPAAWSRSSGQGAAVALVWSVHRTDHAKVLSATSLDALVRPPAAVFASVEECLSSIRDKGRELNTKALVGLGVLKFQEAERGLLSGVRITLEDSNRARSDLTSDPKRDLAATAFLVPAGTFEAEVITGTIFRSTEKINVLVKRGMSTKIRMTRSSGAIKMAEVAFELGGGLQPAEVLASSFASTHESITAQAPVPAVASSQQERELMARLLEEEAIRERERQAREADELARIQKDQQEQVQLAAERQRRIDEQQQAEQLARIQKDQEEKIRRTAEQQREAAEQQRVALVNADKERLEREKIERDRVERERLAAAVEAERQKRLEIEQRLAAAEARERERLALEAREREKQSATPKVFASRKALVIGNDQYADVPKLNNAVADADAMAVALQSVGFNVFKHTNVDEKKFKAALREFRQRVEPGDEVVVFFAGHGVQLSNSNYLLPTDIKGDSEDQIRDEGIQLQRVLDDLQDRRTKFALAVIDACRDNPFKGSGRAIGGRGLAPTTAATGQMILFSAGAGQQALDRLGKDDKEKNGLFTRIFVKEMVKPGVSVDRVLRNVRNEVVRLAKAIGHDQTPALYDQAVGDFYFRQ